MTFTERMQQVVSDVSVDLEPRHAIRRGWPLAELQRRMGVPGVGIAVVAEGRVDGVYTSGVQRISESAPITDQTIFQAGSISKSVAALTALRLVAEDDLGLDDELNGLLKSWRIPSEGGWQPHITVRQLLSHTAGLTVHWYPGYPRDTQPPSVKEVLDGAETANTSPVRVRSLPGVQHSYSGGGYVVLQQLLEDVTGSSFPELARRLVFEPLDMTNSTYEQPLPEALWTRAAAGHRAAARQVSGDWHVYPEMAAAGLWTTPRDLAQFIMGIQDAHLARSGAVLPQWLANEMLRPHATNVAYGLGLRVSDGDHPRFSHGGDDQGFQAAMIGYQDRRLGAVVMTNGDVGSMLLRGLMASIARAYDWPEYPDNQDYAARPPAGEWQALAGSYIADGQRFSVAVAEGGLVLQIGSQPPIDLFSRSATDWFARALNIDVEFRRDKNGVQAMTISQRAQYTEPIEAVREVL